MMSRRTPAPMVCHFAPAHRMALGVALALVLLALSSTVPCEEITITLPGDVPLVLRRIPAGTFQLGSPEDEQERHSIEGPVHTVTLTQDFYMGKYTVTKRQWTAVMGTTPWAGRYNVLDDPKSPAVYVSWNFIAGSNGFMDRLNAHLVSTGQTSAGTVRLPTEAQWEYAARAGTTTRFYWGHDPSYTQIDAYAWYWNNREGSYAHVVGRKLSNAWGLYDMSGNVWEWCQDWYASSYPSAPQTDPTGPDSGEYRVLRGGSWNSYPHGCRAAYRNWYTPTIRNYSDGFRVVAVSSSDG